MFEIYKAKAIENSKKKPYRLKKINACISSKNKEVFRLFIEFFFNDLLKTLRHYYHAKSIFLKSLMLLIFQTFVVLQSTQVPTGLNFMSGIL